jgi:hypothetical protein
VRLACWVGRPRAKRRDRHGVPQTTAARGALAPAREPIAIRACLAATATRADAG